MITLVQVGTYKKVQYYSVRYDTEAKSLFEQFLETHSGPNQSKLKHILAWIRHIGNHIGARDFYFRNESETADTRALPPGSNREGPKFIEAEGSDDTKESSNNLRLYCYRANESVVILFRGDLKTAQKAQDCPQVRPYFKEANRLSAALERAFREGVISWIDDYTDIYCSKSIALDDTY